MRKKVVDEEEDMCKAYRDLIKDERAEAKAEGRAEGRLDGMMQIITDYATHTKCSIERAMELLMVSEENKKRLTGKN